ncbi:hypothetical protein [Pontiella sulfatireligans]|uniref:DUF4168 domain-containing protein n=1 Tax=Pontiella sulfatireligans TaxID=2750658 RepID=A0A6C2UL28_9BACT|nr:hypothetical protein [Pontiella sulfatireligans]VGO20808.1 hypothetical protein SCARR_02875 [Pontiella sulfatireligans]
MMSRKQSIAGLVLCMAVAAFAEAPGWTNLAGNVVYAVPVEVKAKQILFQRPDSTNTFTVALSVFPESEQQRLQHTLGHLVIPKELKGAYEFAQRSILRSRILYDQGHITLEEFNKTVRKNQTALRRRASSLIEREQASNSQVEHLLETLSKAGLSSAPNK